MQEHSVVAEDSLINGGRKHRGYASLDWICLCESQMHGFLLSGPPLANIFFASYSAILTLLTIS